MLDLLEEGRKMLDFLEEGRIKGGNNGSLFR